MADKKSSMGTMVDVERLALNAPVDGGYLLTSRSVEQGVVTFIMLSRPYETRAA